jgi:transcriptional regulator with XRE-family HTH domain
MQEKDIQISPTQQAIINRIMQLCNENNLTISEMAIKCGMPREGLRDIVSGKIKKSYVITIKIICDAFDMTLDEFFATEEFRSLDQAIK